MKKFSFGVLALVLIPTFAIANQVSIFGLGFGAPTINEYESVEGSAAGDIVYDYSRDGFWGRNETTWVPLSSGEIVTARYTTTSTSAIGTSAAQINYATQDYDTHSAVTTGASWKFTAPSAGKYRVTARYVTSSTAASSQYERFYLQLYKNNSLASALDTHVAVGTTAYRKYLSGSAEISLAQGDYIDVRNLDDTNTSHTLSGAAVENSIEISKVSQ